VNDILLNIQLFEVADDDFAHRSLLHGRLHTHRVMAWVCVLSETLNMEEQGRLAFFAAKVHDLGRLTDGKEPGHGLLSADLKLPLYKKLFSSFGMSDDDYNIVYNTVRWHSRADEPPTGTLGMPVINLLKDADGLDRVRLDTDEPDVDFLRYEVSKTLIPSARRLYEITENKKSMSLKEIIELAFELSQSLSRST
jgi:hypothetical protein